MRIIAGSFVFACTAWWVAFAAQDNRTVWDKVYSEEQAKRGALVYSGQCANCHAPDLTGGDASTPLTGDAFTENWNDQSVGDLFERIRISMPQDAIGTLSRQQNADVVAYILSVGKYPSGESELPTELDALKAIKITAKKP
jgi:mono/diheme cytochrome c family protein